MKCERKQLECEKWNGRNRDVCMLNEEKEIFNANGGKVKCFLIKYLSQRK